MPQAVKLGEIRAARGLAPEFKHHELRQIFPMRMSPLDADDGALPFVGSLCYGEALAVNLVEPPPEPTRE